MVNFRKGTYVIECINEAELSYLTDITAASLDRLHKLALDLIFFISVSEGKHIKKKNVRISKTIYGRGVKLHWFHNAI